VKTIVKLFFCIVMITNHGLYAYEKSEALFAQANSYYKEGTFKDAVQVYKRITNKSAVVHYNLGNCFYKLENKGRALLHWRRAEKLWGLFGRGDLLENISMLKGNNFTGGLSGALYEIRIFIGSYIRSFSIWLLQLCFLFLWILFFLYIRISVFGKRNWLFTTLNIIFMVGIGFFLALRYNVEIRTNGVVVEKEAPLLSGPNKTFQELGRLRSADELSIKGDSGEFFKVKAGTVTGWILKKHIGKING
jgi:tetratricopeptide (TPR) repeat protein